MSPGSLVHAARALPFSGKLGLALVSFWIVIALVGPLVAPYPAGAFVSQEVFGGASSAHWFGSDFLGRDVLSRLLVGAQFTVGLSVVAATIACVTGTGLALTAAVAPRWLDELLSRAMDTLISIPSKIFALVLVAAFGSSIVLLTLIVSITYVPGNFRIARSLAVGLARLDYVEVAHARGEGRLHLALVEMLPNMIRPLFADIGLRFVFIVLLLSGLSFLGLGLQPPDADLGSLVRENVSGLGEGALAIFAPAIAIASLTIGVNLLIDAATQGGSAMNQPPHVEVRNLCVTVRGQDGAPLRIVDDVSFDVARGEVLALIGESGSGKTTIALSLMGYARSGATIGGEIRVGDATFDGPTTLAAQRGHRITYVAQSAAAAFNPSRRLIDQVIEPAVIHRTASGQEAKTRAIELFRALALPTPETIGSRYPHELSGGQLQRLMAAMALITRPDLVIFDEPTTALDVTTQVEVLQAFRRVFREQGATGVYVSHDLAVVAQMADQILVLNRGRVRERNITRALLEAPADDYTRMLMAAAHPVVKVQPQLPARPEPVLEISGVFAGYGPVDAAGHPAHPVLSDVSLTIGRGAAVGVIGESGSGKSTVARVVAGLLAPTAGTVSLAGTPLARTVSGRTREQLRRVQIVFQNADVALNPAHSVGEILGHVLHFYHGMRGVEAHRRIAELLDLIQLPATVAGRRCTELSGGQKQRVNLARALAAEPDVILCDEVTSALDTVVRGAILDLLAQLRRDLGVAYLFISHDIATVKALCDEIVVLYKGTRVESGLRESYAAPPFHPYTDLLIASVPELRTGWLADETARVAVPFAHLAERPDLCRFLPRCPVAIADRCDVAAPPLRTLPAGNAVLCHRSEAELAG